MGRLDGLSCEDQLKDLRKGESFSQRFRRRDVIAVFKYLKSCLVEQSHDQQAFIKQLLCTRSWYLMMEIKR